MTQLKSAFKEHIRLAAIENIVTVKPSRNTDHELLEMSCIMRKPVLGVSEPVRHKLQQAISLIFQIKEVEGLYVMKSKALISCTVTAQLICTFCPHICKKLVVS